VPVAEEPLDCDVSELLLDPLCMPLLDVHDCAEAMPA
jgi:hypothetical protein